MRGGKWLRSLPTAVAFVAVVVVLAAPASARAPKDPLDEPIGSGTVVNAWAVAPAGPGTDPTQPSERPYLSYTATPGQVIHDAVTLFNYSNVPLTFRLLATDAFNNAEGAFDVPPSTEHPRQVGTWVKLDQENLALPAKSQATVPLTLTIPRSVTPGDHAGAIIASSEALGTGPDGRAVNVDRRTGTRLYIRVAGKLNPELRITKMSTTYRPSLNPFGGKVEVTYRVENDGNVRLAGKQYASANALFGLGKKSSKRVALPELLPGEGVTLKASFTGLPATFLVFGEGHVTPDKAGASPVDATAQSAATVAVPWTIFASAMIAFLLRRAWHSVRAHQLAL